MKIFEIDKKMIDVLKDEYYRRGFEEGRKAERERILGLIENQLKGYETVFELGERTALRKLKRQIIDGEKLK